MNVETRILEILAYGIKVLKEADVVVCSGGCRGFTTAVFAAHHCAPVVPIERWYTVGVMMMNALVNGWQSARRRGVVQAGCSKGKLRRLPRASAAGNAGLQECENMRNRVYPRSKEISQASQFENSLRVDGVRHCQECRCYFLCPYGCYQFPRSGHQ